MSLRFACLVLAATVIVTACTKSTTTTTASNHGFGRSPFTKTCDPGTQVQLANPGPNQSGVSQGIGTITIVTNGNDNALASSYAQWSVIIADDNDHKINGGPLNLVSDRNGPHPYSSDYYYSSAVTALPTGRHWSAGLVQSNGKCSPDFLGNFST